MLEQAGMRKVPPKTKLFYREAEHLLPFSLSHFKNRLEKLEETFWDKKIADIIHEIYRPGETDTDIREICLLVAREHGDSRQAASAAHPRGCSRLLDSRRCGGFP